MMCSCLAMILDICIPSLYNMGNYIIYCDKIRSLD